MSEFETKNIVLERKRKQFIQEYNQKLSNIKDISSNIMDVLVMLCSAIELKFIRYKKIGNVKKDIVLQIVTNYIKIDINILSNLIEYIISNKLLIQLNYLKRFWFFCKKTYNNRNQNTN